MKVGLDDFLYGNGGNKAAFEALPRTNGVGFKEDPDTLWDYLGLQLGAAKNTPFCNEHNVKQVLLKHERYDGSLFYDEATDRITLHADEMTDAACGAEVEWMQEHVCSRWTRNTIVNTLCDAPSIPGLRRNTLHEWIERETWDGTSRLNEWLHKTYNCVLDAYTEAAGRNWLIGAMARAYRPGCQMDNMLVLEGPQGLGKSRSLEIIGGKFYRALKGDITSKDFILAAHAGWLADIDELQSFRRVEDFTHIKGIITVRTDTVRSPYARISMNRPRRFIFAGTTNNSQYLRDDTGNRRFWPIECFGFTQKNNTVSIDEVWLTTNLPQLLAEAKHRLDTGETWWDMPVALTQTMQAQRMEIDPWESQVAVVLNDPMAGRRILSNTHRFIATVELLFAMGVAIKDMTPPNFQRVNRCAKRVAEACGGWEKHEYDSRTTPITLSTNATVMRALGWKIPVVGSTPPANVTGIRSKF